MSNYNYDLIIIGAGPGGYIAAERAAKLGLKTAIVEKGMWGGVCLNIGCIPTKTLLKNVKIFHYLEDSNKYGINVNKSSIKLNWHQAQTRKEKVVKQLTNGVQFLMKTNKVDTLIGTATALDANTIKITDSKNHSKNYTAKYLIIATGSEVKMFNNPNGPKGLSSNDLKTNQALLTSTEILSLKEIPKTLTVIGGGVIGIEFACLFSSLGTKVTVIEYLDRILATLDHDISNELTKILINNDVKILTSHSVTKLEKNTLTYVHAEDKEQKKPLTIHSDYFLLSAGRAPITKGFDNLGILIKPNGAFAVNEKLEALDQNNQVINDIYVIGDANGEKMLAHVASAQGLVAVNNILVKQKPEKYQVRTVNYQQMPSCVYSFPEIASVGLTETEAKTKYPDCLIKKIPYAINGKALADGEINGFVKLIVDKKYGEILGAHIVSATATDIIGGVVNLMTSEGTVFELANACYPHPTFSELIMEAAQSLTLQIKK
ncbi:MAG: dihydrolipoyl dehydrogenase [Spiroplasma sp.]|nr:dihydrolipoyl dehydrogenase [Spiroplasma sp.]